MQISPFCFSFSALKYQLRLLRFLSLSLSKGNFNSKAGKSWGKAIGGQTGNVQCPWQITHHIIFPLHWRHTHTQAHTPSPRQTRNGCPGISETVAAARIRIPRRITYAWRWQDEKDEGATKAAASHREWRKCLDRSGACSSQKKRKTSNTSQAATAAATSEAI